MKVKYSTISFVRYNENGTSFVGDVYPEQHAEFVYTINGITSTRPIDEGKSFEVSEGDIFECTVRVVGGDVEWSEAHFGPQKITKNTSVSASLTPAGYKVFSLLNLTPKNAVAYVNDAESPRTKGTSLKFLPGAVLNITVRASGYKTKTWTEEMPNTNYAPQIILEAE